MMLAPTAPVASVVLRILLSHPDLQPFYHMALHLQEQGVIAPHFNLSPHWLGTSYCFGRRYFEFYLQPEHCLYPSLLPNLQLQERHPQAFAALLQVAPERVLVPCCTRMSPEVTKVSLIIYYYDF
ncbi:hypothetical protein B296_00017352 [Ensete ventricosum]|uniref:Uncharacterized protein n=1 Tax=Ensete ventricosum TaxID=4639 RepID=A0A427B126_ENSVE|nr:hypothetical protein B296_00017352 [Ensete ventricosum]